MALVLTEFKEMVGTLTLNYNEKRNALSAVLIEELEAALKELRRKRARAVIVRALRGATVFSAGHHVAEMPRSGRDPLAYSDPLEQGIRAIRHFPAPVIAMIEGSVWGGAVELTLCCDLRIAAPTATFALTPVKLGVPYNPAGILRIMNALAPQLVNEMFFTAAPIDADRAVAAGMVNHVVAAERIEAFTRPKRLRESKACGARCTTAKTTGKGATRSSKDESPFLRVSDQRQRAITSAHACGCVRCDGE